MRNYNSLPKWAQQEIEQLKQNQNTKNVGAEVTNCHVENIAVKHSPGTSASIRSIANALKANADALSNLASSLSGKGVVLNVDAPSLSFNQLSGTK